MGNVQTLLLELLLQASGRCIQRERRKYKPVLVAM